MIDMETLQRVAGMKRIRNKGNAEKDYFQEIALLAISREVPGLVFKGGTALYKFHGLDRFSEDLDFSGDLRQKDIGKIAAYLRNFGGPTETELKEVAGGMLATLRIRGLLYRGSAQSTCSFRIDVMRQDEILAEKIRAILTRDKARDVYDVYFLSHKGISVDARSVNAKLAYYGIGFKRESFVAAVAARRKLWNSELAVLLPDVPEFDAVEDEVAAMKFISFG